MSDSTVIPTGKVQEIKNSWPLKTTDTNLGKVGTGATGKKVETIDLTFSPGSSPTGVLGENLVFSPQLPEEQLSTPIYQDSSAPCTPLNQFHLNTPLPVSPQHRVHAQQTMARQYPACPQMQTTGLPLSPTPPPHHPHHQITLKTEPTTTTTTAAASTTVSQKNGECAHSRVLTSQQQHHPPQMQPQGQVYPSNYTALHEELGLHPTQFLSPVYNHLHPYALSSLSPPSYVFNSPTVPTKYPPLLYSSYPQQQQQQFIPAPPETAKPSKISRQDMLDKYRLKRNKRKTVNKELHGSSKIISDDVIQIKNQLKDSQRESDYLKKKLSEIEGELKELKSFARVSQSAKESLEKELGRQREMNENLKEILQTNAWSDLPTESLNTSAQRIPQERLRALEEKIDFSGFPYQHNPIQEEWASTMNPELSFFFENQQN